MIVLDNDLTKYKVELLASLSYLLLFTERRMVKYISSR